AVAHDAASCRRQTSPQPTTHIYTLSLHDALPICVYTGTRRIPLDHVLVITILLYSIHVDPISTAVIAPRAIARCHPGPMDPRNAVAKNQAVGTTIRCIDRSRYRSP